jgi:YfiH family protein
MNTKLAHWPAPKNISCVTTTRQHGASLAPYDANNLALHVGDNQENVLKNRQQLAELLQLPNEPVWLNQTHSTVCVVAEEDSIRDADAAVSRSAQHPLAILTADCLPIMLCSTQGNEIAAIHAGWRGLFNGIVENTLKKMHNKPQDLMAWVGPAICQSCYEVGDEVYNSFTTKYPLSKAAFKANNAKWLANLPLIAEMVLNAEGVHAVYQSALCTYELNSEFYSYRKQAQTGRIATLIWFNNSNKQTQD